MTQNHFQRPPYYDWGLDRWKIGAALLLFGVLFFWLLKTPPVNQLPTLPTPMPITLADPLPGSLDVTAAQVFRGTAPANSPVAVMDAQLGELGRTLSQADGSWTLETGATWTAGAYRLQAVTLDPLTGQPVDASAVVPVVALSSPLLPLRLEDSDLSQNGSMLLLSGQAPPGVMVSVLKVDGDQRTPLGRAQADRDAHWQLQSSLPGTNPFQMTLVAQDPTGTLLAESAPIEVVLPGLLTADVTATAVASLPTAVPTVQPTVQPPPPVVAEIVAEVTAAPITYPPLPIILGLDTLGPGSQVADKTVGELTGTGLANQSVEVSARYYPPGESVTDPQSVAETPLGATVADSAGHWQLPLAAPLAWGRYELFLRQVDQAGQTAAQVGPIAVQVLAQGVSPAQDLPIVLTPSMNSVVAPAPLNFAGTALAASRLRLEFLAGPESLPNLPSAQVWVANDGHWAVELGEILPPGRYQVVAVALDPAGEESGRSAPVDFEVSDAGMVAQAVGPTPTSPIVTEIVPEIVPEIIAETATQAPGISTRITLGTRFPRFSGQAEPNRLLWVQTVDGAGNTQQGYVSAGADGRWSFVPVFPLAPGVTKATVQVVGAAVTARDDLTVQIPEGAGLSGALATELQLMAPTPGLLANRLPPIYGLATPGAQVRVHINDLLVATAQADAQGNWYALPPSALAVGEHWLVVRDDRGDEVGPLILTVTDQTPTVPAPALDPIPVRVDTARHALSGVAQPGQGVIVLLNGVPMATVTADASGRWRWQPASAQAEGPAYVQTRILAADGSVISESAVQVVVYYMPLGG